MCLNSGPAVAVVLSITVNAYSDLTRGVPTVFGGGECTRSDPCRAVPRRIGAELALRRRSLSIFAPFGDTAQGEFAVAFPSGARRPGVHVWRGWSRSPSFPRSTRSAHRSIAAPARAQLRHRSPHSTDARPNRWRPNGGAADASSWPVAGATEERRTGQETALRSLHCHTEQAPRPAARSTPGGKAHRFACAGAGLTRAS